MSNRVREGKLYRPRYWRRTPLTRRQHEVALWYLYQHGRIFEARQEMMRHWYDCRRGRAGARMKRERDVGRR